MGTSLFKMRVAPIFALTLVLIINLHVNTFAQSNTENAVTENISTETIDLNTGAYGSSSLNAPRIAVIDAETGVVIFDKQKDAKAFPASVTKIMTALLTLEHAQRNDGLSERITFSYDAVHSLPYDSSNIAMNDGESLTLEQALYGLMLASANEVANALAEHIGGSQEEFAKLMTERAYDLGAVNTRFKNAHGLHDESHYTTAADIAVIMQAALQYPEFVRIISTEYYELPPTERQPEMRPLNNSHKMILPVSSYYNENVVGGKTGFTNQALHTLVTYAKKDGANLIISVLNGDIKGAPYTDTAQLINYCAALYKNITLFDASSFETTAPVVYNSDGKRLTAGNAIIAAEKDITAFLPENVKNRVTIKTDVPKTIMESVSPGQTIGTLTAMVDGQPIGTTRLFARNGVTIPENALQKTMHNAYDGEPPFGITWERLIVMSGLVAIAALASLIAIFTNLRRALKRSRQYSMRRTNSYRYRNTKTPVRMRRY